jgi:hypothetical protein
MEMANVPPGGVQGNDPVRTAGMGVDDGDEGDDGDDRAVAPLAKANDTRIATSMMKGTITM